MLFRSSKTSWPALAIIAFTMIAWMSPGDIHGQDSLRIATYNASLYGKSAGEIRARLSDAVDAQAEQVAAIIQIVRPDVLLINEIDYDAGGQTAKLLAEKFFAVAQGDREPIDYPYLFAAKSNTGIDSELDLNNNDRTGEPNDCWGYGVYPGQYSMAVYSRFPIDQRSIRTFQLFLWKDFPAALRPVDLATKQPYYDDETWNVLRLSSKNHIDVPIAIGESTLHVLASHPTPPVFDGDEDRNGCRNHDEIRFWVDYLSGPSSTHLVDDDGKKGGIDLHQAVVIMGDLNADPADGDSRQQAIESLLGHVRLQDPMPASEGGAEASSNRGDEDGDPRQDTASFGRNGNMRVDYVLPSRELRVKDAGVFWPSRMEDDHGLISASDHRMVWIEVEIP
jgi:hypothetical protein